MKRLLLYLHTLRHLTSTQIAYRIFYGLKKRLGSSDYDILKSSKQKFPSSPNTNFQNYITNPNTLSTSPPSHTFTFLNLTHTFDPKIDWNYSGHKKLWTYNLNYFDYLIQESITKESGLQLIHQYLADFNWVKDGKEPYPTSLRIINWVKFCLIHKIEYRKIRTAIFNQTNHLSKNLEYHLLGNHLLENAMALSVGAAYVNDSKNLLKGKKLLNSQLKEQILPDGAHFERSPMYHNILLGRLLDTIQILNHLSADKDWAAYLSQTASAMLGWAKAIAFSSGKLPLMKDAANGIAPDINALSKVAAAMQIEPQRAVLKECGYRKFNTGHMEVLIDVGNITPSYQPGHAHADTFNFELYAMAKPVIIDTGTSTYNPGPRRAIERATAAHNTVTYANQNSCGVWASHRVGSRATVTLHIDKSDEVVASHNGYVHLGVVHKRSFKNKNNCLNIVDEVVLARKVSDASFSAITRFHFHPGRDVRISGNILTIDNHIQISLIGFKTIHLSPFEYAPEFNTLIPSKVCVIEFENTLSTEIKEIPKQ